MTRQAPAPTRTDKHVQARDALPDDLKPVFDILVAEYKFFASIHHRTPFVSYVVLADLVRGGWRPPATSSEPRPIDQTDETSEE